MSADRLVVFISSSMDELADERVVVRDAIGAAGGFEPFAWEIDAAAHAHSAQQEWTRQLERTDAAVVLLWKKLGQWTKDEIEQCRARRIPILLFRKTDETGTLDALEGPYLSELEHVQRGYTAQYFDSAERLRQYVDQSLWALVKDRFELARRAELDDLTRIQGEHGGAETTPDGGRADSRGAGEVRRLEPDDARRLPKNRWRFVGRADEQRKLQRAMTSGEPLTAVVGTPGVGRTALLKHLTHHATIDGPFPDGTAVSPRWSAGEDAEDLRQAIWEEFYEADDPSTVRPRTRERHLEELEALLFLSDVDDGTRALDEVLEQMPSSCFVVTAQRPVPPGATVELDGLHDPDEMLAIFENRYRAPVPDEARTDVLSLCASLDGLPSLVEMLGTRAWTDAEPDPDAGPGATHPLVGWAAGVRRLDPAALRGWILGETDRPAVSAVAAAGTEVPREVLVARVGTVAVDDGVADGVLAMGSPRYSTDQTPIDSSAVDEEMAALLPHAIDWAESAGPTEVFENRAFVLRCLDWAGRHDRHADVVRLGRAVATPMALGGRHGAWRSVLEHVATSASALDPVDEDALAWAWHELGTRSFVRGEFGDARRLLHDAFRMRRRVGSDATAALTRGNLGLVPAAVTPLVALAAIGAWGAAVVAGPSPASDATATERTAIVDVDPELARLVPGAAGEDDRETFTVRNVGEVAVTVGVPGVATALPGWLELVDDGDRADDCTGRALEPDDECSFTIVANQPGEPWPLAIVVEADTDPERDVEGDHSVVVVTLES